ncbi:MAG TPA: D-glycerate dehydrogenase [Steroidobacteraceae bacterium]|nr:D-glycerate dehydrogenase [Steroidobacteraceae bacterium]
MTQRPRILLTRRWTHEVEQHLASRYDVTLNERDRPLSADELRAAMRDHDALCPTVTDRIDAAVLDVADRRVQLIGNFGVGFNHIDVATARQLGIRVSNTPDVLTDATAELAILLLLMATRRAGEGERELRAGRWTGWRPTHLPGQSLGGKVLGLVGFGRIAQSMARKAHAAFGMQIAYHSRHRAAPGIEAETGARYFAGLDELVATADVVSLHCPGGPETFHLIDATCLARMKPQAVLVNTARGSVVDEAALAAALADRRIAAAGLDVYEEEPRVHPALLSLENAVLLPHLGSATEETRTAMGMRVAENLHAFFAGQPLRDPVC